MSIKAKRLSTLLSIGCIILAIVDGIIQPGYIIKSITKIIVFLLLVYIYTRQDTSFHPLELFHIEKKKGVYALLFGFALYGFIVGAYFIFRNIFDFSSLTASLTSQTGVSKENFLYVSLYISFVNSLLEEFFFRGFGFLQLKKVSNRKVAYITSSLLFALYHIAMMIGWYSIYVVLLILIGLFVGGCIFDYVDEQVDSILLSWLIHMFANFAINTVGFILFSL